MKKPKQQFEVLSPDGFGIEMDSNYKTLEEAQTALDKFVKRYEAQGYYSTIQNGERVRIPISEIAGLCEIIELKK